MENAEEGKGIGDVWTLDGGSQGSVSPRQPPKRRQIANPENRRDAREWAMEILFAADVNRPENGIDAAIADFWEMRADHGMADPKEKLQQMAESIVRGVWENRDQIDARISGYLENWTFDRIGTLDRAVLRMAIFELFHSNETPPVVVVNEAVDIAKYYSTRNSGRFVNGILNRAMRDVDRPLRDAEMPEWLRRKKAKKGL